MADPNAVPSWEVQRLLQAFSDFSASANRIYDGQLDLAKEAQSDLRDVHKRIKELEKAIILAAEHLREISVDTPVREVQYRADRALDALNDTYPIEIPF